MKLLLTSNGLSNRSIAKTLFRLVGKQPAKTKIVFIPTAMNVTDGDKGWFIDDINNIYKQGVSVLDIVDISALPKRVWEPRLEAADVLFFSGGNTKHLMYWIKKSGLKKLLQKYMKKKVWVGISAGSMVTNPTLALSSQDLQMYYENESLFRPEKGLGFVHFYTRPHYKSRHFPYARKKNLEQIAKNISSPIYALDDNSALQVIDGEVTVISEGEYLKLN